MSDFAKNLYYYRKKRGLTQAKLGEKINYGYTAIANYESGRNEPSFDVLIALAGILGVTVDALLGVPLSDEEKVLLSYFRGLKPKQKQVVLEMIMAMR